MIRLNLLRQGPIIALLCKVSTAASRLIYRPSPRSERLIRAISIPAPTPEMRLRLLGKAPLRLIASRAEVMPGKVWVEILECGHELTAYQSFLWDEKAHLINLEPSAIRRRCQECKIEAAKHGGSADSAAGGVPPTEAPMPLRKPPQSVTDPKRRRAA